VIFCVSITANVGRSHYLCPLLSTVWSESGSMNVVLFPWNSWVHGCSHRPSPCPGRCSYKATKPGFNFF